MNSFEQHLMQRLKPNRSFDGCMIPNPSPNPSPNLNPNPRPNSTTNHGFFDVFRLSTSHKSVVICHMPPRNTTDSSVDSLDSVVQSPSVVPIHLTALYRDKENLQVVAPEYVASPFNVLLWFNTHAHIIKQHAALMECVQSYDEAAIAFFIIGSHKFPSPKLLHKQLKKNSLCMSSIELEIVIQKLMYMGVDMSICTNPKKSQSCLCCIAYHALKQTDTFMPYNFK